MSRVSELIEAARQKEGVGTNYALSKKIEIPENRLFDYENGKHMPDDYAITRLALCLELNPMDVLAEVRSETEKNEKKREFWRNFRTRAAMQCALVVGLSFGLPQSSEAGNAEAQSVQKATVANSRNDKLCAWRRSLGRWWSSLFMLPIPA